MIYIRVLHSLSMKNINQVAIELVEKTESLLSKYNAVSCTMCGSYGKGTDIGKDSDLDLFIGWNPETVTIKDLETNILAISSEILGQEYDRRYASHPYVETVWQGVRVNLVPYYIVEKGQYISAVDRTPHHTTLINSILSATQKDDVRKLKTTLKEICVYGANQTIRGFSGYYTELLVAHYGTYEGVLIGLANLQDGTAINSTDKSPVDGYRLSVVDPVDETRNLSVAVSDECLDKLILYARGVTLKPDLPSVKIDLSKITDDNEDEQTGRRRRELSKARTRFDRAGFVVLKTELDGDYGVVYLESLTLSTKVRQNGPPLEKREACEAYLASRPNAYSENGRLYCLVDRTYTDANILAAEY